MHLPATVNKQKFPAVSPLSNAAGSQCELHSSNENFVHAERSHIEEYLLNSINFRSSVPGSQHCDTRVQERWGAPLLKILLELSLARSLSCCSPEDL
eukprot:CAMPEP_0178436880 /NCGR_PEP_ID=MMETSP0689_2-20121128/34673_1 /TAXON_ID=160604 /ORGANISM="Amphidinium massartii, Strain CS-259" /LENGTH=96 /DNA_ID=CAMNT_0020059001 /DNA_START=176 /DNA_END=466 /DNA_ORIENTATION=+